MNIQYDKYDDLSLVQLIKDGNSGAYVTIYNRHAYALYNYVHKQVRIKEDTEDIIQEIFVWLWNNREKITIAKSFSAYLYNSGKYRICNYFRRKMTRGRCVADFSISLTGCYDNSVEELMDLSDTRSMVEKSIAGLSDKCQLIFHLSRIEQFTIQEIAQHLNLSTRTIENNLSQALKHLRSSNALRS